MPGIGDVRVNLIADVAKFVENVNRGTSMLARFGKFAAATVDQLDKNLEKLGKKATAKLTLPIIGLGIAAVKAADPTMHVFTELERLALQAQKALAPVGRVLIDLFDAALPTMQRAAGVLHNLSERFAAMSPESQKMTIGIVAAVAAIGPLSLGLSALTTLAKPVFSGLSLITSGISFVTKASIGMAKAGIVAINEYALAVFKGTSGTTKALGVLGKNLGILTAAVVGFEAGRYFYDEFKIVQQTAAAAVETLSNGWARIKFGAMVALDGIHNAWDETITALQRSAGKFLQVMYGSLVQIPEKLRPVKAETMEAIRQMADAWSNASDSFDFAAKLEEREGDLKRELAANAKIFKITMDSIEAEFEGKDRKGRSPLQFVMGDLAMLGEFAGQSLDKVKELTAEFDKLPEWYDSLIAKSKDLLDVAPAPFVQTKAEAKEAAAQLEKMNDTLRDFREKARQIRFEVYPSEKAQQDINEIKQLQYELRQMGEGDLLPDEVVSAKIAKIMEELKKLEDKTKETFGYKMSKAVEGFAGRASDTLAEFLIDGKTDLEAFFKSFEKTMLSTMFNSAIFQPAFSWLGGAFSLKGGSALTAPAASGIGVVSAHGNAFTNGTKLNAFASGGVLNAPAIFPMRSGWGLAGERGPEAIAPLTRIGGDLGIKAVPPQISFQVIDQRGRGAPVQVTEQSRGDGTRQIQVLIRDEVNSGLASGAYDTTLNRVFGIRRRGY